MPLKDKGADRMKASVLSIWRPNMGYRMLDTTLLNVFPGVNLKQTYRCWKEYRLGRVKRYRKIRTGKAVPYAAPMENDVWTIDIFYDSCMNGIKLWILSILDASTRESLALAISTHINPNTAKSVLSRLLPNRTVPRFLRSDNGCAFIARSTAMLLYEDNCTPRFIQPAKPW